MKPTAPTLTAERPHLRLVLPNPSLIPPDTHTYPTAEQHDQAARDALLTPLALEVMGDTTEIALDKLRDGATLAEVLAGAFSSGFRTGHGLGAAMGEHALRTARLESATLAAILDAGKKAA